MSYQLYKQQETPLNRTYQGPAQAAEFSFALAPEQFDFINHYFENKFINDAKQSVLKMSNGRDQLLMTEVYRDTVPWDRTNYYMRITATDVTGHFLGWDDFAILIMAAIVVVGLIVLAKVIFTGATDLFYGPPNAQGDRPENNLMNILGKNVPIIVALVAAVVLVPPLLARSKK